MKTPAPTLFFYALATALLAVIAFVVMGPATDVDSASHANGYGLLLIVRIAVAIAGVGGTILFLVAGISRAGRP